jgi:hypothetical protein
MSTFRISQPATGSLLGTYTADTKAGALALYARDAGYDSFVALCEVSGDDPDDDGGLRVQVEVEDFDIRDDQIVMLCSEAARVGDQELVSICTAALRDGPFVIETAKGPCAGLLDEVCRQQAELQGAFASLGGLDISDIDFDADHLVSTMNAVRNAARARCAEVIADAKAAGE